MELFLFARLHATPGNAGAVKDAILEVRGPTRAESGCLAYEAFQSTQDANEFYIHSRWANRAAFDHHVSQSHTIRFAEKVEPLMDVPLKPVLTTPLA